MKYALLLYDNPAAWENVDEALGQELYAEYVAVSKDSNAFGGAELAPRGKTVRLQDGDYVVTDGPFAETKEVLSGLHPVEADSEEQALGRAKRTRSTRRSGGPLDARPRRVERWKSGQCARCPWRSPDSRGRVPRALGPVGRHPRPRPRRHRPRRGRGAGGVRDRGRPLAARRG